jgi:UDP-glucose 4-epimerase
MNHRSAILVTGGAGYIGAHACRALRPACGSRSPRQSGARGCFCRASDRGGDALCSRAWLAKSIVDPQKYYVTNVAGTLAVLDVMRTAGCHLLVFSSTGAVYGQADSKALPENYRCLPINAYGASKCMIERMLADYRSAYGFDAFCLRNFNAAGADARGTLASCARTKPI